jgi:hypothetical protein
MKSLTPYKLDLDCFGALVSLVSQRRNMAFVPPRPTADSQLAYAV